MTWASGAWSEAPWAADPDAGTPATFKPAWARGTNQIAGFAMKKNTAGQVVGIQMCSATDGSAFTGSVTVYVTVDGGTQATGSVGSGACTHEGNGFHTYGPAQGETNGDHVAFTFTGSGAIPSTLQVYPTFPQTGDSFARIGAPAGASISADIAGVQSDTNDIQSRIPAALVSGRIDASVGAMATDVITSTALAASAVTEIQSGLSTLDAAGVRTAVGLASANLDTQLTAIDDYLDTEIAAIKAKTDNLPSSPAATSDIPTAAAIADAVLDEALSGHTTAGTAGKAIYDADLRGSRVVARGTVGAAASTTSITTSAFSPTGAAADQFKGRIVIFDADTATASLRGQATEITASSNAATPTLTVTALTTAPASGDTFTVV